ncbi:DUF642 domain-containing protein [Aquabacterium sp.]|uniref:DUF642 domain-containing protein n=1 Tax=Aquabacterium sp. TaxID=1872578 RepID=UPI002489C67B|nr:DUF642 domain-containing protein [Aquabacterium sp.]MDI1259002.1 DUF642 domain-containing protein [Aquabacterium sp.]
MSSHLKTTAIGLACLVCSAAHANLITNGSFESGTFVPQGSQTMTLSPGASNIAGWQIVNDSLAWIGVGDPWGLDAQDGSFFLDLSDYAAGPPFSGLQQTLTTTPGHEYTVEFYLGSSNRWGRPSAVTVSAAGQSATFTSPTTGTNNDWQLSSFVFVANASTTPLTFIGSKGANYIGLDNVSATATAVPEPLSVALLLAGGAVLAVCTTTGPRPKKCHTRPSAASRGWAETTA